MIQSVSTVSDLPPEPQSYNGGNNSVLGSGSAVVPQGFTCNYEKDSAAVQTAAEGSKNVSAKLRTIYQPLVEVGKLLWGKVSENESVKLFV